MKSSRSQDIGSGFCSTVNLVTPILALLLGACASSSQAEPGNDNRAPEVPAAIQVPGETNKVHFHVFAAGVQIYTWSGTNWVFKAPEAALFANAGANGDVGIHYAGPTWESESGSKVVGTVVTNAPSPNASAIPWLLVRAVSTEGPGIFAETTYVQRVNTLGGKAPANAGTSVGQVVGIPYTAEYYFYRATQ